MREAAAAGKTLKQIAAEIGRSSPVITLAGYRARPTPHAAESDAGDGPHTPDHAVHGRRVDADRVLGADREAVVTVQAKLPVDGDTPPRMGAEDFAVMLKHCPGAFMFLGGGVGRAAVHTPAFDFNDEMLPIGIAYWLSLVREELRL